MSSSTFKPPTISNGTKVIATKNLLGDWGQTVKVSVGEKGYINGGHPTFHMGDLYYMIKWEGEGNFAAKRDEFEIV